MLVNELFESRSANLYHGTNLYSLSEILETDTLTASREMNSDAISTEYRGNTLSVSLTRSPEVASGFSKFSLLDDVNNLPVILVLDQSKLYSKLGKRIRPYNDLDDLDREFTTDYGVAPSARAKGESEAEEAVFGDIENISFFITKIVIHCPPKLSKKAVKTLSAYEYIFNDPRVVIVDFGDSALTGRQFTRMIHTAVPHTQLTADTAIR